MSKHLAAFFNYFCCYFVGKIYTNILAQKLPNHPLHIDAIEFAHKF